MSAKRSRLLNEQDYIGSDMSAKRLRLLNEQDYTEKVKSGSESESDKYPDNMFIKQEYEFQTVIYEQSPSVETRPQVPELPKVESNEILSMLHAIQQQLSQVQKDVTDMKTSIALLESQTIKVGNETAKVTSISEKFDTIHQAINMFQNQSILPAAKPFDFPDILMFGTYEDLCTFDQLLANYEGPYATYFISFIQKKLGYITEFKKFMRLGLGLVMTKELQLKCSYKGSFGHHPTSNMHFLTLLQAMCKATTTATPEEIRYYCSTYFINTRGNQRKKQHKSAPPTITVIDDSSDEFDNT